MPPVSQQSYYEILGITRVATASEVKAAYKRRAKETHPDAGGSAAEFYRVREAYRVLSSPLDRRSYDVPESILDKAGPLTREEESVMRSHVEVGLKIVSPLRFLDADALDVIRCHHEWFDGNGYPEGVRHGAIPMSARVFSVVDAFDAMTTDRPYRDAMTVDLALERLAGAAGRQFDPDVVDVFLGLAPLLPAPEMQIA